MKKIFSLLSIILILAGCGSQENINNYVDIKYREGSVDVADERFEHLDTSKSSFVNGAWYDKEDAYMVVRLKETYYQYCDMPNSIWKKFKEAASFGTYYNSNIKGNYGCITRDENKDTQQPITSGAIKPKYKNSWSDVDCYTYGELNRVIIEGDPEIDRKVAEKVKYCEFMKSQPSS